MTVTCASFPEAQAPRIQMSTVDISSLYETHARSCDPMDFHGQVMRNPHGKSVGTDQIAMILDAIVQALDIRTHDVLLDLCCGNGAITDPIFARCRGGLGVDLTPYLIEVAKRNFERPPDRLYSVADARKYVETADGAERFTKALCYGGFQYLREGDANTMLTALRERYPNVRRALLGSLPDLDRAALFFAEGVPPPLQLRRHDTLFGVWRTEREVVELAERCGWHVELYHMPARFHCAHFRFDVILTAG
jgi:SAM-dependent methyltransferase